jgi:hypothetical protein
VESRAHLVLAECDAGEHSRRHLTSRDLGLGGRCVPLERAADLELDPFGLLVADEEPVLLVDEPDDRVVEVVAANRERSRDDDPTERDDGHLARPTSDVEDEGGHRILHGQPGADRARHRLLDQVRLARPRGQRRLDDRVPLHLCQAARDADDDGPPHSAAADAADEVAEHLLCRLEVRDHPVPQGPGRDDGRRRPAEHLPRLLPDGVDLAGLFVHRHDRRLEEDDPLAAAEDHCVRRPEVDGEIGAGHEGRQPHAIDRSRPL